MFQKGDWVRVRPNSFANSGCVGIIVSLTTRAHPSQYIVKFYKPDGTIKTLDMLMEDGLPHDGRWFYQERELEEFHVI